MFYLFLYIFGYCLILAKGDAGNRTEIESIATQNIATPETVCSNLKNCSRVCLLGYVQDEDGCPICDQCITTGMFEEDIIINDENAYAQLIEHYGITRYRRAALRGNEREWPRRGKVVFVPYVLDRNLHIRIKKRLKRAMKIFKNHTCIRFVPRSSQSTYINIRDETYPRTDRYACAASVGKPYGQGSTQVQLSPHCEIRAVIHELMHTLGFYHEQSRPDRDKYVTIREQNIIRSMRVHFRKISRSIWSSYGSPYDLESVMQYGPFSYTNGKGPTIVANGGTKYRYLNTLSSDDIYQINTKYECPAKYFTKAKSSTPDSRVSTIRSSTTTPQSTTSTTLRPTRSRRPRTTTTLRPTTPRRPPATTTLRPTTSRRPPTTTTLRPTRSRRPPTATTPRPTRTTSQSITSTRHTPVTADLQVFISPKTPCVDNRYCASAVKLGGCRRSSIMYNIMRNDCQKSCNFC